VDQAEIINAPAPPAMTTDAQTDKTDEATGAPCVVPTQLLYRPLLPG